MEKVIWEGKIISIQPRIRLMRSFDERYHNYLGYCLLVDGVVERENREFSIGLGKEAFKKHQFRVGDEASGEAVPVADKRKEPVEYYKVSKLKRVKCNENKQVDHPPWHGIAVDLEVYRQRGHRRLSARTFDSKCKSCIWGCRMAVEIIVDHWEPHKKQYRYETFCYGPKSCKYYKSGPLRKVPGRREMTYEEPEWVDDEETSHREWNE